MQHCQKQQKIFPIVQDQIYSFNYAGGSRPNELRYAYIISTDGYAWDLEEQSFKRFSVNKMRNVVKIYPEIIELAKLPSGIHGDTLVDSYILDGELAYHDRNRNIILVINRTIDRSKIVFSATGMSFVASNGKLFYLSGANGLYAVSIAGKGYYSLSAKEAMAKLHMFLESN